MNIAICSYGNVPRSKIAEPIRRYPGPGLENTTLKAKTEIVVFDGDPNNDPWVQLQNLSVRKRSFELAEHEFDICIAVDARGEEAVDPTFLQAGFLDQFHALRTGDVHCLYAHGIGARNLHTASPTLFWADSPTFDRAAEFARALKLDALEECGIQERFFSHLRALGLQVIFP